MKYGFINDRDVVFVRVMEITKIAICVIIVYNINHRNFTNFIYKSMVIGNSLFLIIHEYISVAQCITPIPYFFHDAGCMLH